MSVASPFEILRKAGEQINPAIILTQELMRKDVSFALEFEDLELTDACKLERCSPTVRRMAL